MNEGHSQRGIVCTATLLATKNTTKPTRTVSVCTKKSLQKVLILVSEFESLRLNWNDNSKLNWLEK